MKTPTIMATVCLALLTGACRAGEDSPTWEPTRRSADAIVGGSVDLGDLAVVMLIAYAPGKDPFKGDPSAKSCTATLVSPHVLVTAAHCVGGQFPDAGAGYTYWIYGGTSVTTDPSPKLVEVKSVAFEPAYARGERDVGVAVLAAPFAAAPPVAMNRAPLDATFVGKQVRMIGYGATDNVTTQSGSGTRRHASTVIKETLPEELDFPGGTQVCSGDSGGPITMRLGGKEVIVAITAAGHDAKCLTGFVAMRMDVFAKFVDPFIAANDPGFDAGAVVDAGLPPAAPRVDAGAPAGDAAPRDEASDLADPREPGSAGCAESPGAPRGVAALIILLSFLGLRLLRPGRGDVHGGDKAPRAPRR